MQNNKDRCRGMNRSRWAAIFLGGTLMILLGGCGTKKYTVSFGEGYVPLEKTKYAAGESVSVSFDMIATDTDYSFFSDDVEFEQSYDPARGYVFTFTMPDHDVKIDMRTRNSMEYDPDAQNAYAQGPLTAKLMFETFDGGGPEFSVVIEDDMVVDYDKDIRYLDDEHEQENGAGKNVVYEFWGVNPGQTRVLIKERSPIAGNFDRCYKVMVDDNLNVSMEEASVKELNEEGAAMRLYIGVEEVPVKWETNASVKELSSILPLTVKLSMYGGFEQVGPLGSDIPREDEQIRAKAGDIVLYSGNQIVLFYGSNEWAYTRLGHMDLPEDELTRLLRNGDVSICLE